MKTVFEPFKIKMVEPIPILEKSARNLILKQCHYNLFSIPARYVSFDMLTDSGTSAMSSHQWSAMLKSDESYAGADSFYRFCETIQQLTGLEHVIPTHQGRSAEALLCKALLKPNMYVAGNTQFDTTRANIESSGATSVDLPCLESSDSQNEFQFKGNVNLEALEQHLKEYGNKMPFFIMTVTNNSVGGQPVSMKNIRLAKKLLNQYGVPLVIDAARFAENCFFIKQRETDFALRSIKQIALESFAMQT